MRFPLEDVSKLSKAWWKDRLAPKPQARAGTGKGLAVEGKDHPKAVRSLRQVPGL